MKTITDLVTLLKNGAKPVVEFGADIESKESYADKGMRARVIGVRAENTEVIRVNFDFSEFDVHNLPLETANYYDKAGNPTLTARAAGFYHPQEELYFDQDEPIETMFTIVSDERTALYAKYLAEASGETYIGWLESKVLAIAIA